jgi:peptide-methionine (R)-S-oxide reductase
VNLTYFYKNKQMIRLSFLLFMVSITVGTCQNQRASKDATNAKQADVHNHNPYYSRTDTTHLNVPDAEWKKVLPEDLYLVARKKATEQAFTGRFWDFEGLGTYYCAACGNPLFRSDAKFASSCGWPSFYEALRRNSVRYETDTTYGMVRTEVLCGRCDGHLGHIFDDGPEPTGKRFCMNSIILDFEPDSGKKSK